MPKDKRKKDRSEVIQAEPVMPEIDHTLEDRLLVMFDKAKTFLDGAFGSRIREFMEKAPARIHGAADRVEALADGAAANIKALTERSIEVTGRIVATAEQAINDFVDRVLLLVDKQVIELQEDVVEGLQGARKELLKGLRNRQRAQEALLEGPAAGREKALARIEKAEGRIAGALAQFAKLEGTIREAVEAAQAKPGPQVVDLLERVSKLEADAARSGANDKERLVVKPWNSKNNRNKEAKGLLDNMIATRYFPRRVSKDDREQALRRCDLSNVEFGQCQFSFECAQPLKGAYLHNTGLSQIWALKTYEADNLFKGAVVDQLDIGRLDGDKTLVRALLEADLLIADTTTGKRLTVRKYVEEELGVKVGRKLKGEGLTDALLFTVTSPPEALIARANEHAAQEHQPAVAALAR